MNRMLQRSRKLWHLTRRRYGGDAPTTLRWVVAKSRWQDDALAPVVLMIDDLTNAWHSHGTGTSWDHNGDWGGGHRNPGSTIRFLEDHLLADFPEVKITFFVVAGPISRYTHHQPFRFAAPLDDSEASIAFFRGLDADERFELAYHGYNHGTPGDTTERFLQEWRGFRSPEEAVNQTRRGLNIFQTTLGHEPRGGKYGGWDYNDFADSVVAECGFRWWCRDWMPRDDGRNVPPEYYDTQYFGTPPVVAIPTTLHGHYWDVRQVEVLLQHQQIISIEEHIAAARPDGLVQTPNVFDDIDELRRLYRLLRKYKVWHANCSEIADYVTTRDETVVTDASGSGFRLQYHGILTRPQLTFRLYPPGNRQELPGQATISTPHGDSIQVDLRRDQNGCPHYLATVPVMNGQYGIDVSSHEGHQ